MPKQRDFLEVIYSDFCKDTGVSIVKINTDCGVFEGKAHFNPKDGEPSEFIGCEYAECRAIMKYHRAKEKIAKAKLRLLLTIKKDFQNRSIPVSFIQTYIYRIEDEIQTRKNFRNSIKNNMDNILSNREKLQKIIKNKREN